MRSCCGVAPFASASPLRFQGADELAQYQWLIVKVLIKEEIATSRVPGESIALGKSLSPAAPR